MQANSPTHWSDYWAGGSLTSLPQDFSTNYDAEIGAFWKSVFQALPGKACVLDLCTGNGAIALLAAEHADHHGLDLEVTAVDAADINPEVVARKFPAKAELLDRISFIGNRRVEELDLPDSGFDLVSSQYGIEYCDWPEAAAQVARMLKPGGRFVLVCHASSSDILKYMEDENREYELLAKLNFLKVIRRYLDGSLAHKKLHQALEKVWLRLQQEQKQSGSPLLTSMLGMLASVLPMDEDTLRRFSVNLELFYRHTQNGRARLEDLLRVNRAIANDPGWYRVFENQGLDLQETGEIFHLGKHHSGTYYRFVKPVKSDFSIVGDS